MQRTLTRQELYVLVWMHPRTALAKQFGVSDVWIGKQCRSAWIPMPPPGFWARALHGKSSHRPALPIRLPGMPRHVVIGESSWSARRGVAQDPEKPVSPPVIDESVDAQVSAALALIGKVSGKRDLSQPHKGLARVLDREEKRRAKFAADDWSFHKPRFADAMHQRQLRLFNSLCWIFDRIGVIGEVYEDDHWIQGLGTIHQLRFRLSFGGASLHLRFLEPSSNVKAIGEKSPETTTLRVEEGRRASSPKQWSDSKGCRLEDQLGEITKALLQAAEMSFRDALQRDYEWRLKRHEEHLREMEAQRVEAEKRRLRAIEARRQKVRNDVLALAQNARAATEIRAMVSDLAQHPDMEAGSAAAFEAWRTEALAVADSLDPMKRPLSDVLRESGSSTG